MNDQKPLWYSKWNDGTWTMRPWGKPNSIELVGLLRVRDGYFENTWDDSNVTIIDDCEFVVSGSDGNTTHYKLMVLNGR